MVINAYQASCTMPNMVMLAGCPLSPVSDNFLFLYDIMVMLERFTLYYSVIIAKVHYTGSRCSCRHVASENQNMSVLLLEV